MEINESSSNDSNNVFFKKKKVNISLRKNIYQDDEKSNEYKTVEDNDDHSLDDDSKSEWEKLREIKLLNSLKKKHKGLNALELLNPLSKSTSTDKDKAANKDLSNELDLGNTFSVETNRRDEDADMLKYIEEQLAIKKGLINSSKGKDQIPQDLDEVLFKILPEHLLKASEKKSEEMLSNQMLSGIPEVDLGIEERIRNIEATEEAKSKLMERKRNRPKERQTPTLVPINVSSNYVQHNSRFNVEDNVLAPEVCPKKSKISKPVHPVVEEPVVVIGDRPIQAYFRPNLANQSKTLRFPGKEKASDDYHFEKFKKQFKK